MLLEVNKNMKKSMQDFMSMERMDSGDAEVCLFRESFPERINCTFQTKGNSLGRLLEDILSNKFYTKHGFLACWLYLGFWKKKTKFAFITELKGKCVLDACFVSPV